MIRDGLFYLGGMTMLGTVLLHPLPSVRKPEKVAAGGFGPAEAKAID